MLNLSTLFVPVRCAGTVVSDFDLVRRTTSHKVQSPARLILVRLDDGVLLQGDPAHLPLCTTTTGRGSVRGVFRRRRHGMRVVDSPLGDILQRPTASDNRRVMAALRSALRA